MSKIKHA